MTGPNMATEKEGAMPKYVNFTALAMILFASCNRQNEAVKVNVPDTVRVCDTVIVYDCQKPKIFYTIDDSVYSTTEYFLEGWEHKKKDAHVLRRYGLGLSDYLYIMDDWYPDSLSACRALRSRLEHQKDELNRKIDKLKCEGK